MAIEMEKKASLKVAEGKVEVKFDASADSDKDGKKSAEVGAYVKIDIAELLEEVAKANDQASLLAIAGFVEKFAAMMPTVEKEL